MKTNFKLPVLGLLLLSTTTVVHSEINHSHESLDHTTNEKHDDHEKHDDDEKHNEDEKHDEHEEGVIELSPLQQKTAGIVVESLRKRELAAEIRAPGEVKLNAYKTAKVTSRILAQAIKRHVSLGDHVETGQKLVTLSSVDMAEAQGALMLANQEWRRVKKLGPKVASERRYTEARVARQLAYAKVSAYGMTSRGIEDFLRSGDARRANGEFVLLAPQNGTVAQEDFIEGAVIEPGHELLTITDESSLWVEARLTPQQLSGIDRNTIARVQTNAGSLTGRVTQLHHTLDESTRTIAVRITLPNPGDRLHPGEFVDVYLQSDQHDDVLAVPEAAVVRSPDGDWQVFIAEHDNEFRAVEVKVLQSSGGYTRIEGPKPGTRIVTQGAFFLQSELAKSGFDIHNH